MTLGYSDTAAAEGFAPQIVRIIFHNSTAAPGEGFKVDLHWQNIGDEPSERDYWIFVHFRPESDLEEPYPPGGFSWEFPPARNTTRWQTGFVVKEEGCFFRVPQDIEPGRYTVLVGLYDRDGGWKRIPLMNKTRDVGEHRYKVGQVTVVAKPGQPSKLLAYRLIWRVREAAPETEIREPRYITRGRLGVGFDPGKPVVRAWQVNGVSVPIGGDPAMQGPEAEFVSLEDKRQHSSLALDADWFFNSRIAGDTALYKCRLRWKSKEVARFDIRYQVDRTNLNIKIGAVHEAEGFHLISVTLPSVVSVPETAPGATLAIGTFGGRLVNISESGRHRQVHSVGLPDPIPGAVAVSDNALAAVWVRSLDDKLVSEVMEAGPKHGTLGIKFTTRIRAENPSLEFAPSKSGCFEVYVQAAQPGQKLSWIDGVEILSKYLRARPNPLYMNSLVYKLFLDSPGQEQYTTFDEALETIRRVHYLTNGAPQVVYLVGWQHEGHDTGYPDTFVVNKRLGGTRALRKLFEEAEKLNAVISFHDNFDDAYQGSSGWDPSIVGQNGKGDLIQGGVWAGGQSYIISPKVYVASGKAQRRVDKMMETFPLKKSIHLDVMSATPMRYDHNPTVFAGADDNMAARKTILEMWKKRGIDVTSEALTAVFCGPITHYWHISKAQEGGPFSSETPAPIVPLMLHGKVTWGGGVDSKYGEPLTLLYGGTFSEDWNKTTPDQHITDRYYLITLPWSRLAAKGVTGYWRDGNLQRVTYEGGDYVEADLEAGSYKVVCGGYIIAQNYVTTTPIGRHEIAVYSTRPQRLSIPFPPGWSKLEKAFVEVLDSGGNRTPMNYRLNNGRIEIEAPASRPVIVSKK